MRDGRPRAAAQLTAVGREVRRVQPPFQLSVALWARIAPVLAAVDPTPPPNAPTLLDALAYRALTGTDWDALPETYPPAAEAAAARDRWQRLGLFDALAPLLRVRLFE
jgi:transposase